MTILHRVLAVALAGILLAALGVWRAFEASRVERSGTLRLAGLAASVEIRFDGRARPFVRADTLGDALFTQGVLHARERLWQMELLSRAGQGRLAEMLGPPLLDTDRELWKMGVPQLAARIEAGADARTRTLVARYVAGVNAALARLRARPPELLLTLTPLRPWTPTDVYALGAAMAHASGRNAANEMLRFAIAGSVSTEELAAFLPDETRIPEFPYVVSRTAALALLARRDVVDAFEQALLASPVRGSNGWAVAPERSRSGVALFAFDSHDALALPNLHYEVHLFFAGRSLRGWSVPGLPGVINGMNDRLAWGFTNIGDSQDLFLETRHPEDRLRFLGPDGWYDAETEEVSIAVRGREPERLRIVRTRHGPLIEEDPPLALAWSGHHADERALGLDALFDLNLARDWGSANKALDRLGAPSANVTYADVDGHVAFRTVGLLPIRGRGQGLVPLPGHERGVAWRGFVPMASLPRRVDPPEGFVAAANARVGPPGVGPLVSADNAPGYRIGRIQSVLSARRDHTPETMRALQMDWYNGQAARLLPSLLAMLASAELDAGARAARDALVAWQPDPVNAPEAVAPWLFLRWYLALAEDVFAERLGPDLYDRLLRNSYVLNHALDGLILAVEDASPWWRGDRRASVRRAFVAAAAGFDARSAGSADWRWDAHHRVHLQHELAAAVPLLGFWLDRGGHPWGGDHASVGRARYRYDRPKRVHVGAAMRTVVEMTDPMRIGAILPGGQAGHPSDPHYDDQIGPWLRGELDRLPATFDEASGSTLRLEPRARASAPPG